MRRCLLLPLITLLACLICTNVHTASAADASGEVRFNRDIRPILAANCYHCHGPDEGHREADLRLDQEDGISDAFGESNLEDNEAWQRLISTDDDYRMPPPDAHKKVKPEEIEMLKAWIAQAQSTKVTGRLSRRPGLRYRRSRIKLGSAIRSMRLFWRDWRAWDSRLATKPRVSSCCAE